MESENKLNGVEKKKREKRKKKTGSYIKDSSESDMMTNSSDVLVSKKKRKKKNIEDQKENFSGYLAEDEASDNDFLSWNSFPNQKPAMRALKKPSLLPKQIIRICKSKKNIPVSVYPRRLFKESSSNESTNSNESSKGQLPKISKASQSTEVRHKEEGSRTKKK